MNGNLDALSVLNALVDEYQFEGEVKDAVDAVAELVAAVKSEHIAWRKLHDHREYVDTPAGVLPALKSTHIKARERTAKALAAVKGDA